MKITQDLVFVKILVGKLTRPVELKIASRVFKFSNYHRGYLEVECIETKTFDVVNSPRELVNFLINNTTYMLDTTNDGIYELFVKELFKAVMSPKVGVTFEDIEATIASMVVNRPEEMARYSEFLRLARHEQLAGAK
ncbi:MAG TPA: hypothetical protein PLI45_03545 [Candidatus Woesebacteria bacterium]|nr:hypothetical protein [Candidatus Woesebacteria bacterium]